MNGVERTNRYVESVISEPHLYPLTIFLACERYKRDLKRKDIYLNEDVGNYVVNVVESMPHTKGTLQGKPMLLEDWQCFFYVNVFAWKWSDTDLRRFRYADLYVPRKNGKTAMAIPAMLLMFAVDQEPGAEVFLGAVGEQHAKRLLYKPAKYICENHEDFKDTFNIEVNASSIVRTDNDSVLTTVIKDPNDGDSPHAALVDEYHEHKNSNQYETFETGMGGRDQPLLMVISTAGTDLGSPCKSQMDECEKILNGSYKAEDNDDKFCMLFVPDKEDVWNDIKTLRKVNPNMGVSVGEKYLLSQLKKATQSAEKQNAFKTKHCNFWVGAKSAWLNMLMWQRQAKDLDINDFKGQECHITCDLASTTDIASIHATFKDGEEYISFPFFYAPESAVNKVKEYRRFSDAGDLVLTDGDMTDYEVLENKILDLSKTFNVLSISFDPHQATYLQTRLASHKSLEEKVMTFAMNRANMSDPMSELEGRVSNRQYWHDGNSCMTWMIGNTCNAKDNGERSYPVKENRNDDRCHIDGSITAIMGVGRWLSHEEEQPSVYKDRGVRSL